MTGTMMTANEVEASKAKDPLAAMEFTAQLRCCPEALKIVRADFNPKFDPGVGHVKQHFAALITEMIEFRDTAAAVLAPKEPDKDIPGQRYYEAMQDAVRCANKAIDALEMAAMYAVKAVTAK